MDEFDAIFDIIKEQLDQSYKRLLNEEMVCKTVGIRLKDTEFNTINRSYTFNDYTDDFDKIYDQILDLFEKHYDQKPVRLAGVALSQLLLKKRFKKLILHYLIIKSLPKEKRACIKKRISNDIPYNISSISILD